jgi:hypothetical protein
MSSVAGFTWVIYEYCESNHSAFTTSLTKVKVVTLEEEVSGCFLLSLWHYIFPIALIGSLHMGNHLSHLTTILR